MAKLDFKQSGSNKMISQVMKKVDEKELDNIKRDISVDLIDMNEDNEYVFGLQNIEHFAETIKEDGFNDVVHVYAKPDGRYEINNGHRRYLAAVKAGMKQVPCIVKKYADDKTRAKLMVKANTENRKITPLRMGRAMVYYKEKVLYDFKGNKREELARVFDVSGPEVYRYMSLTKLIPEFQREVDKENYPYNNLTSVINLDEDIQRKLYKKLMEDLPLYKINKDDDIGLEAYSQKAIDQQVNYLLSKESASKKANDDEKVEIPAEPKLAMNLKNKKIVVVDDKKEIKKTKAEDKPAEDPEKVVQIEQDLKKENIKDASNSNKVVSVVKDISVRKTQILNLLEQLSFVIGDVIDDIEEEDKKNYKQSLNELLDLLK